VPDYIGPPSERHPISTDAGGRDLAGCLFYERQFVDRQFGLLFNLHVQSPTDFSDLRLSAAALAVAVGLAAIHAP